MLTMCILHTPENPTASYVLCEDIEIIKNARLYSAIGNALMNKTTESLKCSVMTVLFRSRLTGNASTNEAP